MAVRPVVAHKLSQPAPQRLHCLAHQHTRFNFFNYLVRDLMSILSERAARTRIQSCKVGEWTFVVREPSRLDMSERGSVNSGSIQREVLERYVVDWSGFKECDLFVGGSQDVVQFDQDAFKEWIGYHPECWGPISDLVVKMYTEGQQLAVQREEALKNLVAG